MQLYALYRQENTRALPCNTAPSHTTSGGRRGATCRLCDSSAERRKTCALFARLVYIRACVSSVGEDRSDANVSCKTISDVFGVISTSFMPHKRCGWNVFAIPLLSRRPQFINELTIESVTSTRTRKKSFLTLSRLSNCRLRSRTTKMAPRMQKPRLPLIQHNTSRLVLACKTARQPLNLGRTFGGSHTFVPARTTRGNHAG